MEFDFSNQNVIVTGAAHGFGRAISLALACRGARVWSCDILADELQEMGEEGQRALIESLALRRLGSPVDIAHAVLFLASDQAGWITGQVLPVDEGRL